MENHHVIASFPIVWRGESVQKNKSHRTGSESCSLCLVISFSLVRCSRACLKEGSWKNIYSSGRNGATTHASPAHPWTPWDKGGWQRVLWVTKAHIGGFQSWEYWELSMGHVYLEPSFYVFSVTLRMSVGGKQDEPCFSYVWARCAKWETLLLFLANSPVLFPALYFSPLSMLCRWRYFRLNENTRKKLVSWVGNRTSPP